MGNKSPNSRCRYTVSGKTDWVNIRTGPQTRVVESAAHLLTNSVVTVYSVRLFEALLVSNSAMNTPKPDYTQFYFAPHFIDIFTALPFAPLDCNNIPILRSRR